MTLDSITLLLIIGIMVVLFLSGRLSPDITALATLTLLAVIGLVDPSRAFDGFASPAVVLMVATFAVSGAIRVTGLADRLAERVVSVTGVSEFRAVLAVTLIGASVSSIMNNVAAVAVLLPAVASVSKRSQVPPGKLFIPLAFGVLLGGTCTLMGTSPNILAAEVMRAQGLAPFSFLDFTPFGVVLVLVGTATVALVGRHLLPGRRTGDDHGGSNLSELYRLHERLCSLRIPSGSALIGRTLADLHFAEVLGAEVVAIRRDSRTILAPQPGDAIARDDLLIVRGRINELQALFRLHGVKVEPLSSAVLSKASAVMEGGTVRVNRKLLAIGRTLKEIGFRARYGVAIVGINRGGKLLLHDIVRERLLDGDLLLVVGTAATLRGLANSEEVSLEGRVPLATILKEGVFTLEVPSLSALADVRVRDSRLGELVSLSVIAVMREGAVLPAVSGDERIRAGDMLFVAGEVEHANRLAQLSELVIESESVHSEFESPEIGIMEVVLSPRSKLFGRSIEDIQFRERYGFNVLAVWRDGEPRRARFSKAPLKFGDALLLQGLRSRMHLFSRDPDFVVLSGVSGGSAPRREKAPIALTALLLMVGLSVSGIVTPHLAAVIGALTVVLSGTLSMEEFYREIEWRVVLLVGALIPIGGGVESLGLASVVSHGVALYGEVLTPLALLALCALLSSILSQALDGVLTVVLLGPIAIEVARRVGVPPEAFMMVVTLSASIAFLTPFSHRANLLVMGPGGYRPGDFWKIGILLTVVTFAVLVGMIAIWYELLPAVVVRPG